MIDFLLKNFNIYLVSFFSSFFLIVFLLNLPILITGETKLIDEYYFKNFNINIFLDSVFVLFYLLLGLFIIDLIKTKNIFTQSLIIFISSFIITTLFYIFFTSQKKNNMFFSRWFHTVGLKASLYDGVYLVIVFLIFNYMRSLLKH